MFHSRVTGRGWANAGRICRRRTVKFLKNSVEPRPATAGSISGYYQRKFHLIQSRDSPNEIGNLRYSQHWKIFWNNAFRLRLGLQLFWTSQNWLKLKFWFITFLWNSCRKINSPVALIFRSVRFSKFSKLNFPCFINLGRFSSSVPHGRKQILGNDAFWWKWDQSTCSNWHDKR